MRHTIPVRSGLLISFCMLATSCNAGSAMLSACEEAIKLRLKAPSSYARFSFTESQQPIRTRDAIEYRLKYEMGIEEPSRSAYLADFAGGKLDPVAFKMVIEYDAQNSFGALLRASAVCDFFDLNGKEAAASPMTVRIDGDTHLEWVNKLQP